MARKKIVLAVGPKHVKILIDIVRGYHEISNGEFFKIKKIYNPIPKYLFQDYDKHQITGN